MTLMLLSQLKMHRPTTTTTKSVKKKVSKLLILILIPVSQNPFYVYQSKHDFLEIHNGRGKFWPSKGATKDSSRFASSPRLKLSVQKRMSYLLRTDWHASLAFCLRVCSHGCHVGCLWRQ